MTDDELKMLSAEIGRILSAAQISVTTAESCTGGWIAKSLTDIAGSSAWFEYGFVTYSNAAKEAMIGVSHATLEQWGAVSEQVVCEMALGALNATGAQYAISVSGIAGPGGGNQQKPVGTVWIGFAVRNNTASAKKYHFTGDRDMIRRQATGQALKTILKALL